VFFIANHPNSRRLRYRGFGIPDIERLWGYEIEAPREIPVINGMVANSISMVRTGHGIGICYVQILSTHSEKMNTDKGQEKERHNPPCPFVMNEKMIELSNTGFFFTFVLFFETSTSPYTQSSSR
jgi:hypothetical protein